MTTSQSWSVHELGKPGVPPDGFAKSVRAAARRVPSSGEIRKAWSTADVCTRDVALLLRTPDRRTHVSDKSGKYNIWDHDDDLQPNSFDGQERPRVGAAPSHAAARELSPEPSPKASPQRKDCLHQPTAVQGPRARCGCRGVTVEVESGPLNLTLEAKYAVGGTVLLQTWSESGTGTFASGHFVHVRSVGPRGLPVAECDLASEGGDGSCSSGLIKVRRMHVDGESTSASASRLPLRCRPARGSLSRSKTRLALLRSKIDESRQMTTVEEGDILVRVDHVQVLSLIHQPCATSSCWHVVSRQKPLG